MPGNSDNAVYFIKDSDQYNEDDIYIDCQPVNEKNVVTSDTYSGDVLDGQIGQEVLDDITSSNFNIYDNVALKSLLAVGIFAVILVSGNYVFNTIPNSRLQKAINNEKFR
jgi:hypothetical protein